MKKIALAILVCGGLTFTATAQDYDLVINNGRVMDPESNFDGIRNVGLRDGGIVAITKDAIKGKPSAIQV